MNAAMARCTNDGEALKPTTAASYAAKRFAVGCPHNERQSWEAAG